MATLRDPPDRVSADYQVTVGVQGSFAISRLFLYTQGNLVFRGYSVWGGWPSADDPRTFRVTWSTTDTLSGGVAIRG